MKKWGTKPYEIWVDLADGYDVGDVSTWVEENDVSLVKYVNKEENRKCNSNSIRY